MATLRVARIALDGPLSSSSLGDEKRVSSLVLRSAARDPFLIATLRVARIALDGPLSSSSLGDEKRVSSLVLRSAARDPGAEMVVAAVGGEGRGEYDLRWARTCRR
jgi:hypothetical protein